MKTLFVLLVFGLAFAIASEEDGVGDENTLDEEIDDFVNEEPLSSDPAYAKIVEDIKVRPKQRRHRFQNGLCLAVLCRCTRKQTRAVRRRKAQEIKRLKAKLLKLENSRLGREIHYVITRLGAVLKPYLKQHPDFAKRLEALLKKLRALRARLLRRFRRNARGWKGCGCAVKARPCPKKRRRPRTTARPAVTTRRPATTQF